MPFDLNFEHFCLLKYLRIVEFVKKVQESETTLTKDEKILQEIQ